jgi:hypothetical protein
MNGGPEEVQSQERHGIIIKRRDIGEGNIVMPRHATAKIEDVDLKIQEPPSAEEMERREEVASLLLSLMDRPVTEEEREFWREFEADLKRDRPQFR